MVNRLESIVHIDNLFDLLLKSKKSLSLSEIANQMVWTPSKTFRILHTLNEKGYLIREPDTKKFRLGFKLWELGCAAVDHLNLRNIARPIMEELIKDARESVYLMILDDEKVIYIDRVESSNPLRAGRNIGGVVPVTTSSGGKIILAYQCPNFINTVIQKLKELKILANIQSINDFRNELLIAKYNGFSTNISTYHKEIAGVGAPIFNYDNKVVAAISLTGHVSNFKGDSLFKMCNYVKIAAKKISVLLGHKS